MIQKKTTSKSKQSVESIDLESFNSESSSRLMRNARRVSIIFSEIFDDESENARISHYIQHINQLKYWIKKDENFLIKTWMNIQDESTFVMNDYNKKIMKMKDLINDYETCLNKLNDTKLIIRKLKIELREKNLKNTLLFIIEDEVVLFTFKKLSDFSVFTDDKNLIIDD